MRKSHVESVTTETVVLDSIVCDLCHSEAPGGRWGSQAFYDVNEAAVGYREGIFMADDGEFVGMEWRIDLCPACFKSALLPFLESQGCVVEGRRVPYWNDEEIIVW